MLDRAGNHVPPPVVQCARNPANGQVIGLGGAAREDDFVGPGCEQRGDLSARALDRLVGLAAVYVGR